eukprot:3895603-Amphidinium_carterae.2
MYKSANGDLLLGHFVLSPRRDLSRHSPLFLISVLRSVCNDGTRSTALVLSASLRDVYENYDSTTSKRCQGHAVQVSEALDEYIP